MYSDLSSTLPPWDGVVTAAELYLVYCDCQPLPLFNRETFMEILGAREPEILLSILALSSRFSANVEIRSNHVEIANNYAESARLLVIQKVSVGPIEISTLQSLCLLSLIDFTSK